MLNKQLAGSHGMATFVSPGSLPPTPLHSLFQMDLVFLKEPWVLWAPVSSMSLVPAGSLELCPPWAPSSDPLGSQRCQRWVLSESGLVGLMFATVRLVGEQAI